jgi:hypothetical protein
MLGLGTPLGLLSSLNKDLSRFNRRKKTKKRVRSKKLFGLGQVGGGILHNAVLPKQYLGVRRIGTPVIKRNVLADIGGTQVRNRHQESKFMSCRGY